MPADYGTRRFYETLERGAAAPSRSAWSGRPPWPPFTPTATTRPLGGLAGTGPPGPRRPRRPVVRRPSLLGPPVRRRPRSSAMPPVGNCTSSNGRPWAIDRGRGLFPDGDLRILLRPAGQPRLHVGVPLRFYLLAAVGAASRKRMAGGLAGRRAGPAAGHEDAFLPLPAAARPLSGRRRAPVGRQDGRPGLVASGRSAAARPRCCWVWFTSGSWRASKTTTTHRPLTRGSTPRFCTDSPRPF